MTAGTGAARSNNALGALFILLATLCYASMDAISKFLVADYAVIQIMWVRCALIFLFSWIIVRRQGLAKALRSERPWLQFARSLILLIESAIFVLAFRYLPLADAHALAATSP